MSASTPPPVARRAYQADAQAPASPTQVPRSAVVLPTPTGLTSAGVVLMILAPTVLVAVAETLWHDRLTWVFGITFAAVALAAAWRARPSAAVAALCMPPLAFLAAVLVAHPLLAGASDGLKGLVLDSVTALAAGAPFLVPTSLLCLVVVAVRQRRSTELRHRP